MIFAVRTSIRDIQFKYLENCLSGFETEKSQINEKEKLKHFR